MIARAHAYRGQVLVRRCQHIEAQQAFADAERHLRRGTGDRELEATLWELRAIMARDQLDTVRSGRLLEKAVALLRDSPGHQRHLAVVLIEKGDRLSEQGDCSGARKDYFEAMRLLPGDRYPRLRLRVEHNLAVDEFRNGELDAAYERFARAASLYEQCGDALVKAQRNRVLASIHIMNRNWNDAEKMLHAALGG
ncbi:MAG: hypothetical protein GY856_11960, partial [bacterium]|nr:hypothetical protein [bacterium]